MTLLTEEEAKGKWCPFSRVAHVEGAGVNRTLAWAKRVLFGEKKDSHAGLECNCIGSACMAWRWRTRPTKGSAVSAPHPGNGYCGLAGRPGQ